MLSLTQHCIKSVNMRFFHPNSVRHHILVLVLVQDADFFSRQGSLAHGKGDEPVREPGRVLRLKCVPAVGKDVLLDVKCFD